MPIEVDTITAPAGWACYLVNGDCSGMNNEDITDCDAMIAALAPWYVVDCERDENGEAIEARFSWNCRLYGATTYSGGDLIDYVVHNSTAPATLSQASQALANC